MRGRQLDYDVHVLRDGQLERCTVTSGRQPSSGLFEQPRGCLLFTLTAGVPPFVCCLERRALDSRQKWVVASERTLIFFGIFFFLFLLHISEPPAH